MGPSKFIRAGRLAAIIMAGLASTATAWAANSGITGLYTPAGSGAPIASGDFVSGTNLGGLDTYYRYFIEVPPGTSRLRVDLFDPDVGAGGCLAENDGQRDKQRPLNNCSSNNFNTTARYRLFDPAGNPVPTQFTIGDATQPAGGDNAWVNFYDSATVPTGGNYRDEFSTVSYGNNDGTLNWSGNWTEVGDDGSPASGNIRIQGGRLRVRDASRYIYRFADLSGAVSATLSLDVDDIGGLEPDDCAAVWIWDGTTSTLLEQFCDDIPPTSRSYDITPYMSANSAVILHARTGLGGGGEWFAFDNVNIQVDTGGSAGPPAAGHWELRVDMSSAVTGGDDINALGIRAYDGPGNEGTAGTELNVYAESYVNVGVNNTLPDPPDNDTRAYKLYPYITSGCTVDFNDWDMDSDPSRQPNASVMTHTSRTGASSVTYRSSDQTLSLNNQWLNNSFTGWVDDQSNVDYGIWTSDVTMAVYPNNGNYVTLYYGDDNAADPVGNNGPPTSQPEPNTFRFYLPTDGANGDTPGAAPAKPYVTQRLTHVSGPNPPQAGQTSRVNVTISVTNPAANGFPITFSASNLVTAYVPGGAAVYAGNAQVSQGSVTAEPSIGGSGNITWNPGAVAAGTTAVLGYQVDVTPASAGQRIPVTGTVTSNGTTARYVDKTGNTTQPRATYTFGPLCGLAVTEGLATYVTVEDVSAEVDGGEVWVTWRTASEIGTAGYHLLRRDGGRWVRVNEEMLPALVGAARGGDYRLRDPGARPGRRYQYLLVEVEAGGGRQRYGPFEVEVPAGSGGRPVSPVGTGGAAGGGALADATAQGGTLASRLGVARSLRAPVKAEVDERFIVRHAKRARRQEARERRRLVAAERRDRARGFTSRARDIDDRQLGRLARRAAEQARTRGRPLPQGPQVRIAVREDGLYFVPVADIAQALGEAENRVRRWIRRNALALYHRGERLANHPAAEGDGIYFYGLAPDDNYNTENVYWLQRAPGEPRKVGSAQADGPAPDGQVFPATLHAEQDLIPVTVGTLGPDWDYWHWSFLIAGDPNMGVAQYPVATPGAAPGGAELRLAVKGFTDTPAVVDHQVQVAVNGTVIGSAQWAGQAAETLVMPFDAALLNDGDNTVTVTGQVPAGAGYSMFMVDGFDLSYPRRYQAVGDQLTFQAAGHQRVTVDGFSNDRLLAFDLSDPSRPVALRDVLVDSGALGFRLTLSSADGGGRYLALSADAAKAPLSVEGVERGRLQRPGRGAEYLVIAPDELAEAAEGLAALRRGQGLSARVVTLSEIYNDFGGGLATPHALRDFLGYAYRRWQPAPRYAVLVGNGSLDYRDLMGLGDNLMPPFLAQTPNGLYAADNSYGDVEGGDGVPEIAVGRLPVLTPDELQTVIDKIAAYEAASGDWRNRVVMVADDPDRSADFGADSDRVAAQIPSGYQVQDIDLAETPAAQARTALLDALKAGAWWVNYIGHGASDRLAAEGLLVNGDVTGLNNGARLPVVTALTCTVSRFEAPGYAALGELLVLQPDGGAIAVWAPTGLSLNSQAAVLNELLFKEVFGGNAERLGDAVRAALGEYQKVVELPYLVSVYTLLGDPALRLR